MKFTQKLLQTLVLVLVSTSQAFAFNFGFVRVPDWMDTYIMWLAGASLVSWLGLMVTKPAGVPMNQLPNVQISPIANVFRFALLIAFMILMGMVFLGMGLQRYSEA